MEILASRPLETRQGQAVGDPTRPKSLETFVREADGDPCGQISGDSPRASCWRSLYRRIDRIVVVANLLGIPVEQSVMQTIFRRVLSHFYPNSFDLTNFVQSNEV